MKTRRDWSRQELKLLRKEYPRIASVEVLAQRLDRSVGVVYVKASELGLRRLPKAERAKSSRRHRRHIWTRDEEKLLRRKYPNTPTFEISDELGLTLRQVYQKAVAMGLKKTKKYLASPFSGRISPGNRARIGVPGRFRKGHTPWNKGTHFTAGGRSAKTRFKKGSKPYTWVPVGTEVRDRDGYLKRKIKDDRTPGLSRFNWKYVHILLWEKHRGKVPKGHRLVFKNGNKADIRLGNLELITHAENMRRNTVHRYPKPLVQVIQLRGAVKRQINRRKRGTDEKQNRRSA